MATLAGAGAAGAGLIGGGLQGTGAFDPGDTVIQDGPFKGYTQAEALALVEAEIEKAEAAPTESLSDDTLQRASEQAPAPAPAANPTPTPVM
jgi:hypothetical protein